jgi:hypothetical protein
MQDPGQHVAEEERRARVWVAHAREDARARDQIIRRINAARRALCEANLRTEQAEARAREAEEGAGEAEARSRQAVATAKQFELRAHQAEARLQQAETAVILAVGQREQALSESSGLLQERDAILSSTIWRATAPLRIVGRHLPLGLRRMLRTSARLVGATLKLPRKLRAHA